MQTFQAAGWQLNADVYPEGRHEMFQEINRDEVIARLLQVISEWV
jgi:alpha-beta hydrolase superfamily lysophospholipase